MHNNQNSYHIQRDTKGFILYSRIKCCAMCDFCSSRTEFHTPIMSMDDESVAVNVTYCTRNDRDTIKDTSVIPEWCPVMELLQARDIAKNGDPVENVIKQLFPES